MKNVYLHSVIFGLIGALFAYIFSYLTTLIINPMSEFATYFALINSIFLFLGELLCLLFCFYTFRGKRNIKILRIMAILCLVTTLLIVCSILLINTKGKIGTTTIEIWSYTLIGFTFLGIFTPIFYYKINNDNQEDVLDKIEVDK